MRALTLLLGLAACTDADTGPIYKGESGDTYVPWPDDTGETGTDADGDGWSVEAGDCDDDDIYANPGWEEGEAEGNHADGIDNDCDGRVDEAFRGLIVVQQGDGTSPARIVATDSFGETDWEVELDDPNLIPYFLSEGVDGGWVIGTLGSHDATSEVTSAVYAVDEQGGTTLLWDFSDAEVYEWGMWGLATHPGGYYAVATGDAVQALEPDGSALTPLASWDPEAELYTFDVALDPSTGDLGVFGYLGGFAILRADGAVETLQTYDPNNVEYVLLSGLYRDEDGWYAGGEGTDGWHIYRFNLETAQWVDRVSFNEDWTPHFITVDAINGGFFVSTTDATYPVVWRLSEEDGSASRFFLSPYEDYDFQLWELYTRY